MKTQVMEDKPDFEQIAKHSNPNVVSDKYTYDSEGHQSLNPKWARAQEAAETYARCEVVGMERIWKQYVLPLQSELSSAQEKNRREYDLKQLVKDYFEIDTMNCGTQEQVNILMTKQLKLRNKIESLISEIENKKV